MVRTWSMVLISGLNPPWTQNTFPKVKDVPTINNSSDWKVIKHLRAIFPRVSISVLPVYFIIESIHCRNLPTSNILLPRLVIPSQQSYSIWIFHFQAKQVFKCLNWVVASINKISNKDVACFLNFPTWIQMDLYLSWKVPAHHRTAHGCLHKQ